MLGPPCVPLGVPGDPWIAKMVLQGTKIMTKWCQAVPCFLLSAGHQGAGGRGEALRSAALCNFIAQLRRRVGNIRSKALGPLFRFLYTFVSTTLF